MRALTFLVSLALAAPAFAAEPYLVVLGVAQDGGAPQAGHSEEPGWKDASKRGLATSVARRRRLGLDLAQERSEDIGSPRMCAKTFDRDGSQTWLSRLKDLLRRCLSPSG